MTSIKKNPVDIESHKIGNRLLSRKKGAKNKATCQ